MHELTRKATPISASKPRWRAVLRIGLLTVAATVAFLHGLPVAAHAGSYKVHECSLAGGAGGAPDAGLGAGGGFGGGNACPMHTWTGDAGGLLVHEGGSTVGQGAWSIWEISIPPNTHLSSAAWGMRLCDNNWWSNTWTTWRAYSATWGRNSGGYTGLWYSPNAASPDPAAPRGCATGIPQVGPGTTTVGVGLFCGASQCLGGQGIYGYIGAFTFVLSDPNPPRVANLGGSLLAGGPRAGMQRLDIAATDQGAGVREAVVRVNGQEIARPQSNCALSDWGTGTRMVPCPLSTGYSLNTDTARGPWHEGLNGLEVCVREFSTELPPLAECASRNVLIDNSCLDSQGALGQGAQLTGGLARSAQDSPAPRLVVRSDQSATIRGTLSGSGGPVAGANLCLYEQIDAPAEIRQLVQVTKSRSDGGFTLQVPAGPSRAYDLVYRNDSSVLERRSLYLESVAVPTLKVNRKGLRNRQAVGFYGELPGPRAGHRTVGLQALAGKKCRKPKGGKRSKKPKGPRCRLKWRTFKVLTTKEDGGFAGKYRFTQTRGKARYRFRAIVAKQNGYPYSPGTSAEQSVRVRGKEVRRK